MHLKNIPSDNLFFTSDQHFGHANIIKYCNRPFKGVDDMDKAIIQRWNEVIPKDGIVFTMGDLSFKGGSGIDTYIHNLNGEIYTIVGNHDKYKDLVNCKRFKQVTDMFDIIVNDDEFDDGNQKLTLTHYPMTTWNQSHRGSWNLFGHHHGSLNLPNPVQFDVGVDTHNFYPYSWQEVKETITKRALKH